MKILRWGTNNGQHPLFPSPITISALREQSISQSRLNCCSEALRNHIRVLVSSIWEHYLHIMCRKVLIMSCLGFFKGPYFKILIFFCC